MKHLDTFEREKLIKEIANKNNTNEGYLSELDFKLMEEMAELTQATIKYDQDDLSYLEELADVILLLRQKVETLDEKNTDKLDKCLEFKILRTASNMRIIEEFDNTCDLYEYVVARKDL